MVEHTSTQSGRKFIVDEGGNRRLIISPEDIRQALTDLREWFKINAPVYYTKYIEGKKGASDQ
jgi:hypothetical protein